MHDIPEWMQHRWLRWTAIAVFAISVTVLIGVHADVPDEAIHVTR